MSDRLSRGPLQVLGTSPVELNDVLRQIRQELDELHGLRGRVRLWDRLGVSDPSERSDVLVWGGPATVSHLTLTTAILSDGSAATPSRTYTTDLDLGTYRIAANHEGFTAGGVLRWDYDVTRLGLAAGYALDAGANRVIGAVADKLNAAHLAMAAQAVGDVLAADTATSFSPVAAVADGNVFRSAGVGALPVWGKVRLSGATQDVFGVLPGVNGGTGLSIAAVGDLLYASATTPTWSRLADVAAGAYLRSGGVNTAPLWSTLILPNAATTNQIVRATATNTWGSDTTLTFDGTTFAVGEVAGAVAYLTTGGSGDTALSRAMAGLQLAAKGMNVTNKYTPAIKFMSTDVDLTTENPKLLALIVGRATEAYTGDTAGGAAIDFATAPNAPGATSVPLVRMTINQSGIVGIGTTDATGQLVVDQASTTAAIPALVLEQRDVSEQMMKLDTTIGVGNAIEAVGAKTLTTTHFVKVNIVGVGDRYFPVGTIA